jgi:outer membrane receptor protein involved in Fe transport
MNLTTVFLLLQLPTGTIHGEVRADSSLEVVPFATVEVAELGRTAVADAHGYFLIPQVPEGSWTVRVRALGYRDLAREVRLTAGSSLELELRMVREPVAIAGVSVEVARGAADAVGPPPVRLDPATIRFAPGLAEADVLRTVQILPAVQAMSDFSSALYMRGGASDQNLITLDGVPLFNAYHLGGLFSAFTPEAVGSVEVVPGALSASEQDRLSGAVHVRTREGARDRIHGSGAIGLISSRAALDGPVPPAPSRSPE